MKILHITPAVFGPGRRGGGERYVSELFRAQRQLGMNVQVLEIPSPVRAALYESPESNSRPLGIREVLSVMSESDIVHVHQLNTSSFDVAALMRPIFRYKLILTDHGGGNLAPGRIFGKSRLYAVDGAAFVSNWSRADIDPDGKVVPHSIVYGGGDHVGSASSSTPLEQVFDFGFVGRLLPHKGAHVAIAALPPGSTLIVAGEARDPEYRAYLETLAQGKHVTFRHDVKDDEIANLYQSIGRLLVPSVSAYRDMTYSRPELLGLVALEALFHGTPVVGSNVGGLGEMLSRLGQVVVEPGDVNAWAKVLTSALETNRTTAPQEQLTWESVARNCLNLYESILQKS